MKNEKISVEQAARVLGISPNEIRKRLRDGTLPIGHARKSGTYKQLISPGKYRTAVRYTYDVYKPLIMKYVGLEEWE